MKRENLLPNWCLRHPVWFMAFYTFFYLSCFSLLEKSTPVSYILVRCRLDYLIPFCKYAIIPYAIWFVWIPFTLFFLLLKGTRRDFWRLCLPLFAGMTISLLVYLLFPSILSLRPVYIPGTDVFARAVQALYRTDTPSNVCPSIHVLNSVTLLLAYLRCDCFKVPHRRWMRPAAVLLCVSIVCSTMLLKQHSVIDVVMGILLALLLDRVATRLQGRVIPYPCCQKKKELVS